MTSFTTIVNSCSAIKIQISYNVMCTVFMLEQNDAQIIFEAFFTFRSLMCIVHYPSRIYSSWNSKWSDECLKYSFFCMNSVHVGLIYGGIKLESWLSCGTISMSFVNKVTVISLSHTWTNHKLRQSSNFLICT